MSVSNVISLLGGVALFLFGMGLMGDGMKQVAGNKMELVLYRLAGTPLKGILLGTAVTAVIQSSSATSVMVVGFVNSAMMTLKQAISVIMGSIVGTSITGWIICLGELDTGASGITSILSTATLTGVIAVIGIYFRMFSKDRSKKHLSSILLGFAVLMYGISAMSSSVAPLKESEKFVDLMTSFSNPALGLLVGIVVTAILQSASSAVGLLQTLAITGAIDFSIAFPILLGMGIGASVPVLRSAMGANTNAKRAAGSYLLISVLGALAVGALFYILNALIGFSFVDRTMTSASIALVNTIFRAVSVILLFPFMNAMEHNLNTLIKESGDEEIALVPLEERFLDNPTVALQHCGEAVEKMSDITCKSINKSLSLLTVFSDDEFRMAEERESIADRYEDKIGAYLIKLNAHELDKEQTKMSSRYLHVIGDLERISDHALNIAECAQEIAEKKIVFSEAAVREIRIVTDAVREVLEISTKAFFTNDVELAYRVEPLEETIDNLCDELKSNHIERLQRNVCTIENGFVFNDLITNFERVSDHCSNIGLAVIENATEAFESHEYVDTIKEVNRNSFDKFYDEYSSKYRI